MKIRIVGFDEWIELTEDYLDWEDMAFPFPSNIPRVYPFYRVMGIPIIIKKEATVVRYPKEKSSIISQVLFNSEFSMDDWKVTEKDESDEWKRYVTKLHPGLCRLLDYDSYREIKKKISFENIETGKKIESIYKSYGILIFPELKNFRIPEKEIHYKSLFLTTVYENRQTSRSYTKDK